MAGNSLSFMLALGLLAGGVSTGQTPDAPGVIDGVWVPSMQVEAMRQALPEERCPVWMGRTDRRLRVEGERATLNNPLISDST